MATVLSPHVSDEALSRFAAAVGPDAVLTEEAELREFRDPFAHSTWDDYTASAVVMPQTVEEIQEVLRIANELKVPLWTVGQGRNNGYGGPAPRVSGSVIVCLRRMNRVLIGFSPVAPLTGRDALRLRDLLRGLLEQRAGLDYIVGNLAINARSFIHVTMVLFDTKNERQARRAYDAAQLLVREAAREGCGEYRAHLDFMDLAADQYGWGDHAYRRFTETIKDALDPNGILSPGKQGIWPKEMRGASGTGASRR